MTPIGRRDELVFDLARFNTGPEREGDDVLHGPGIRVELPPGQNVINQMLITIVEEEIVSPETSPSFDRGVIHLMQFARTGTSVNRARLIIEHPVSTPIRYASRSLSNAAETAPQRE